MFVRNFLTSGDFLTTVPIGYKLTLQYDVNGTIEKVLHGWGDDLKSTPEGVLQALLDDDAIPRKIAITKGTTFVYGVLYTNTLYKTSGMLPECIQDSIISDYLSGNNKCNFFAGDVKSYASVFRGANPIRQWLAFSGFNVLPGYVVPYNLDDYRFEKMVNTDNFAFIYPLISDYIVFHNGDATYYNLGFSEKIVITSSMYADESGELKARLSFVDESTLDVNYSDVVTYQIGSGSVVILDENSNIIYALNEFKVDVPSSVECPFCKKLIHVPAAGVVKCDDPQCNSRLYTRTTRLLESLHLPKLSYSRYLEYTNGFGDKYSIVNVLDAPEYEDTDIVTSLPEVVFGTLPSGLGLTLSDVTLLCNRVNNSRSTLLYYFTHSDRLVSDLKFAGHSGFNRLAIWLADPVNVQDIENVLHHPKVTIEGAFKKFEGLPILRNKTLLVTGEFIHGPLSEITAILSSYSANIVTDFGTGVDCVIVGDSHENVNGHILQESKKQNIPIFTESEFFARYQIDNDIAENL